MATVDIVIPLYNKEATVARAVQSVLDQTFADWRLTIVNDGSTDSGLQIARQFTDPRIQIIEQENRGPAAARNRGIQEATEKYIAFLDADDQWYSWYLENALKAFLKSDVACVGTMYEDCPHPGDMSDHWARRNVIPGTYEIQGSESPKDALSLIFFFHVGNSLVRTEIAQKYGGFYDAEKCLLGEDTVFFAKLILNEPFSIITPTAVRHNRQDSDLSNLEHRPLDIFLHKPEIILDHCPDKSRAFAELVLAYHAMRVAHFRARSGNKTDAIYLTNKFPRMQRFGFHYHKLCIEI
ncbi:MAG: glycosyltransferase family 2 protein, partial [Planctomycetota bacterium]